MGILFRSLRSPVRLNNIFDKNNHPMTFRFISNYSKHIAQVLHLNLFAYFRKDTPDNVKYTISCVIKTLLEQTTTFQHIQIIFHNHVSIHYQLKFR